MNIYDKLEDEAMDRGYRDGYQDACFGFIEQLRKVNWIYDSKEGVIDYLNDYIENMLKEYE